MAQSALPQPGDLVGGKYRIERTLGQGGMGVVFEASHRVTEKRFAIKWLLSEPTRSEDSVTRFVREAQVAGRCEHRNIVQVYDIDREAGTLFMVMELLKGESLSERLAQQGRMFYREACRLLVPCIEAVGEAHGAGIIHRDLKPANIFLCRARGREPEMAKVLDFGVSRFAVIPDSLQGARTKSGAVVGTPFYMAPEQMRGQPIDERVDVYSMGVTLYEVLAGVRPYDAASYGDLLLKIAEAKPPPLSHLVSELPAGLIEIVNRAMAYERDIRFRSMEELACALEPYVDTNPVLTTSTPSVWREGSHSGDTPWVADASLLDSSLQRRSWLRPRTLIIGAAALAALGGGFYFLHREAAVEHVVQGATMAPPLAPSAPESTTPATPEVGSPNPSGSAHAHVTEAPSGEAAQQPSAAMTPDAGVPHELPNSHGMRAHHPRERAHTEPRQRDLDSSPSEQPAPAPRRRAKVRAPATLDRSDF
jgi:eukaryotic-like serine/threonine-protein kinase